MGGAFSYVDGSGYGTARVALNSAVTCSKRVSLPVTTVPGSRAVSDHRSPLFCDTDAASVTTSGARISESAARVILSQVTGQGRELTHLGPRTVRAPPTIPLQLGCERDASGLAIDQCSHGLEVRNPIQPCGGGRGVSTYHHRARPGGNACSKTGLRILEHDTILSS